ncbi:hypothetical protein HZH68_008779 [Vespula germanica]|uniref:Uncharacterized protein n=1 Tax=Vespula germanica TaxID=30212 RepID=A0A834K1C6_VESGE|nr:hypothetical protein HZH68_008779 [Vespula germanica]
MKRKQNGLMNLTVEDNSTNRRMFGVPDYLSERLSKPKVVVSSRKEEEEEEEEEEGEEEEEEGEEEDDENENEDEVRRQRR